jgi:hypothetical protein
MSLICDIFLLPHSIDVSPIAKTVFDRGRSSSRIPSPEPDGHGELAISMPPTRQQTDLPRKPACAKGAL